MDFNFSSNILDIFNSGKEVLGIRIVPKDLTNNCGVKINEAIPYHLVYCWWTVWTFEPSTTIHRGQPKHRIDCPEHNSSIGTKIYPDISDRPLKMGFGKSFLSIFLDIYLHVTTCHQLLEGVYLVNPPVTKYRSWFRNAFRATVKNEGFRIFFHNYSK